MRVLHVVPSYFPAVRYGGPVVSHRRLSESLAQAGVGVDIATTDANGRDDLDVPIDRWVEMGGARVRYFHRWPRVDFAFSTSLAKFLTKSVRNYDLVYVVGTFSFPSLVAGAAARSAGIPYIVAPLGTIQPWSLSQKRWKKLPYWKLFERRNLEGASAIHVTSEPEADAVSRLFPRARIFLSPHGVDTVPPPDVERNPRRVVFLGRIHKVKGFDVLIPALARVAAAMPEVKTVVAGPDDVGEWARVEKLLESVSPRPAVRYVGPVNGDDRWALLASSAVFVLPSHTENFGVAVVEALACGTPVVVSRNTPWRIVQERGAGFWVENTPEQVALALLAVLRDPTRARRMGAAGIELARAYSWKKSGEEMVRLYRDIVAARSGAA
jgi:glycosyltransferase involved in cell wall biosynthesis